MKFGYNQYLKFETYIGAYSTVTEREYYDSQITATDEEHEILVNYFGHLNINVGNVGSNPKKSKKEFLLYPTGKKIYLNLVFPKTNKPELRLYISSNAGFKPKGNSIWFIFIKKGSIWIGSLSEIEWRSANSTLIQDDDDFYYQENIFENDEIRSTQLAQRDIYLRDRKIALKRMELENYKCEYDPKHQLFIAKSNRKPFLEAHHLLPISLQKIYNKNLDRLDNLFCLCPFCHRAIHHSEVKFSKQILETLISKRPGVLKILKNSKEDIIRLYSVEEII